MSTRRQRLLRCIAAAMAIFGCGTQLCAFAQSYPTKPIRMIVPFSAGSATDLLARRVALKMGERWSQQVVVDNRGGAGGVVGTNIVASATADGYTLLVHSLAYTVSAALYSKLPFDPYKDLAGVSQIAIAPSVVLVAPSLGVRSVKELIALAKSKPGKLNFGTAGVGSGTHFNSEQFKFAAGIDTVHIPYKGVPEVLVDTMQGRIQYFLSPLVPALPLIRDGRLLALAVTTPNRTSILPDTPTVAEAALPGYAFQAWWGVFAPAKTPRPILEQLSKEVARIIELPDVKKQMHTQGEEGRASTPEAFTKFVHTEIANARKLVKLAGIRVE